MTFEDKAKESLESGIRLYEEKKYNSCINRVYYGIFQNILHKLDTKSQLKAVEDLAKKSDKGTHNFTIDWYIRYNLSKKVSLDEKIRANRSADTLRDLRHKADYSKEDMTEKIAKSAIRHGNDFFRIVKNR